MKAGRRRPVSWAGRWNRPQPPKRPVELEGTTYKIRTPLAADALYVTINDLIEEDGRRRPYEIFINTKNLQYFSWIVAMTRLISSVFRHDPAPRFLVEELKSIYDPNGGYFSEGTYIPSLAADIGRIIEKHLENPSTGGFVSSGIKRCDGRRRFALLGQCRARKGSRTRRRSRQNRSLRQTLFRHWA